MPVKSGYVEATAMKEKRDTNFPPDSHAELLRELDGILEKNLIQKVTFAFDRPAPIPESQWYLRPRIVIPVKGIYPFMYSDGTKVIERQIHPGEAIFAIPYGWTRPTWTKAHTSFGIVFRMGFTRFIRFTNPGQGYKIFPPQHWYHNNQPLSASGEHTLQALTALARSTPDSPACVPLFNGLLGLARAELAAKDGEDISEARHTWRMLCEYIQEHCADTLLDRGTVARTFNLHPNYISRLFTEQGKESFNAFTNRQRLERAAELIKNPSLTIEDVAEKSGFGSSSYFIKQFSEQYGTTPAHFRSNGMR
jgi:AraC-like DNA-binding protein